MGTNEIGAELSYFSKLWSYWSNKCTNGEITEYQMENKIDRYEGMSTKAMKNAWERIKSKEKGK